MPGTSTRSQVRPVSVWFFLVLGLILIALFLIGSRLLLSIPGTPADEDAVRGVERARSRAALESETAGRLNSYGWVDRAKGQVQIPITEAMRIVTARLAAEQPRPARPANPAPSPQPSPPTEAAPAAATP